MLLVLAYWCYLWLGTSLVGLVFQKFFRVQVLHPAITICLGSFGITLVASVVALFFPLDGYFDLMLGSVLLLLLFLNRHPFRTYVAQCYSLLLKLPVFLKVTGLLTVILAAAKSAGVPFIIDNESYYLQTIKWLDTYGIVNGVANVHPFLAQTSGWHLFESAINLNSLYSGFNDTNGFVLLVATFYAFSHLAKFTKGNFVSLSIGLFPVFNLLLFQFIDAPSPDLPVYVLGYLIFSEFLKATVIPSETNRDIFVSTSILAIFAVFLKVSALVFLLFPLYLVFRRKNRAQQDLFRIGLLAGTCAVLFILKNYFISGYPLYPLALFEAAAPWKLPESVYLFLTEQTKYYGYGMTEAQFLKSTIVQRVWHWLFLPGLHGIFNKAIVLLVLAAPFFIRKNKNAFKKPLWVLYGVSVVHLLLVLSTSPQYRFYLLFLMLLTVCILGRFIQKKWMYRSLIVCSLSIILVPLFLPVSLQRLTTNKFLQKLAPFQSEHFLLPHPVTRYTEATYEPVSEEKFVYYSATNIDFFWASGDGPLPCVQKQQIDYFKEAQGVVPQQISETISDGFFSKNIAK